jgi:hypothetical protein
MPVVAINTFALRPGVSTADFDRFSRELDRPACLALDVVESFEVFLVDDGPAAGGSGPVDVVEVMTVRDWAAWERERDQAPALAPVTARFGELVDTSTVTTHLAQHSPMQEAP